MNVKAIKTRAFLPPQDDLQSLLRESFLPAKPQEKSIIVITSKIVSIAEGRCVKIGADTDKHDMIKQEADFYIDKESVAGKISTLTIKNHLLVSSSGIDESNANGYYVLWPKKPFESAKRIYEFIKKEYQLENIGIIISDSHRIPLRLGALGMAIAYYGFYPLRDYRGNKDIFGRSIKYSRANIADALATAAVVEMGEGNEQTPIAIIEGAKNVEFTDYDFSQKDLLEISIDDDIYWPLLKFIGWKKEK